MNALKAPASFPPTATASGFRPSACAVVIEEAGEGLGLILQSGAVVECRTGISIARLLAEELGLSPERIRRLDVFFLNGKPVDAIDAALVPDGSRLALAAGIPGIAGLAMRSGSAVAGLRPGITHREPDTPQSEVRPGRIEVALFSLALPLVAGTLLRRGVLVPAARVIPYLRPALMRQCLVNGTVLTLEAGQAALQALPPEQLIGLRAFLPEDDAAVQP